MGGRHWRVNFTIDDKAAFSQVEEGLRRYLEESHDWFRGEVVNVDIGRRVLGREELARLRRVFEEEFQLRVARFWCGSGNLVRSIAEDAAAPVVLSPERRATQLVDVVDPVQEAPLYVKNTCRSGTAVCHNGDVIVLGDLNPGAQISATGDIIVIGALRGIAHAGANGNGRVGAVIVALSLRPLQLRIGRHFSVAPANDGDRTAPPHPEIAYVSGGSIVVTPYRGGFQRPLE